MVIKTPYGSFTVKTTRRRFAALSVYRSLTNPYTKEKLAMHRRLGANDGGSGEFFIGSTDGWSRREVYRNGKLAPKEMPEAWKDQPHHKDEPDKWLIRYGDIYAIAHWCDAAVGRTKYGCSDEYLGSFDRHGRQFIVTKQSEERCMV